MPKTSINEERKVTVKDVARASGVSATTVSRVLSGSNYPVSAAIRGTVLKVAGEMNYKPNLVYRSRKNTDNEIVTLIPTFSNPFFTSVITGFENMLKGENFHTLVYDVSSWLEGSTPNMLVYNILKKKIKGVLIASPVMYPAVEEFRNDFISRNIKVVMADCPKPNSIFNSVYYDYKKGSYLATEYLINQGHRRIVYAGLKLERESRELRVQGFLDAMRDHEIPCGEKQILILSGQNADENTQIESGEKLARQVLGLGERPTAVAVINDIVAFGMLRGFHRMNVKIPEEISIIGFDDSVFCEMSYPALTTVKVQSEQMGKLAAMLLLNEINGTSHSPLSLSLEPCIVERDSVSNVQAP
ncbi:MAG: LacI family transcriptional regulator [Treponema sp.]|jgi:DNA-binding LacI/PurR family transcriptional regulator|nr:LacI family transcriptional regulator [Treponema sp.]